MTSDEQDTPPPGLPSKPGGEGRPASLPERRSTPRGRGPDFSLPQGFQNDDTERLVELAQQGDADALNDLFARYHSIMVEVARRRLGPRLRLKEDPDDLAQTTFREATRDFGRYQYQGEGSLLRWLMQILQNKIRDKAEFYSAGKRDASKETALGVPIDPRRDFVPHTEPTSQDLSVTRQVQRDERFDMLREALGELTPEYRTAITLVFFQGLSLREAGQRMGGRSEDALRMMLRRAENRLGEILRTSLGKDFGGERSPG